MFEIRDKFGSTREKVFKVLRSVRDFGEKDYEVSLPAPAHAVSPYETTYSLAERLWEAKLEVAQVLANQRLFDQPK